MLSVVRSAHSHGLVAIGWVLLSLVLVGCPESEPATTPDASDSGGDEADQLQPDEGDAPQDSDLASGPTLSATTQSECLLPEPEVGETAQSECIGPPPEDITEGATTQSECVRMVGVNITDTEQSECRDEPAIGPTRIEPCSEPGPGDPDQLEAIPGPGRIHLVHANATHNCCGLIEMVLTVDGPTLTVTEREVFDGEHGPCYCLCEYGVSADITGLSGGSYTVRLVDGATGDPYGADIPVTVPGPESVFTAAGGPGRIDLTHLGARHTCCMDVAMQFAIEENDLTVWEEETGDPCDCICDFDLKASIKGLLAGTYDVQFLDGLGGTAVGSPISVPVGDPEAEIRVDVDGDAIAVHHDWARWNCCGQVKMEVSLDEVNHLILVEEVETAAADAGGLYPCRCQCLFDLMVEASGFPAGLYTVRVFTTHNEVLTLFGEIQVNIPGSPESSPGTETVWAETEDEYTISVHHSLASYNCCSDVALAATLDGWELNVQEVVTNEDLCDCVCTFQLEAEIGRLLPGNYQVNLTSYDGTLVGTALALAQGDNMPAWAPDEVILTRSGAELDIVHKGMEYSACSDVEFLLEVEENVLDLIEVITNPADACYSRCHYDLSAQISGLDPAEDYTVRLWTDARLALLHEEVVEGE